MKLAIIGTGVAGIVAAHYLHREHDLTLFEADGHVGGHVRTIDVTIGDSEYAVDTGFVVYNEVTYPRLTALLRTLRVVTRPTSMSFGVRCERSGIEYCGTSLNTFFAQRRNLLRPSFVRMARDILRFNRRAKELLAGDLRGRTLGDLLAEGDYGKAFVDRYIVPMGAAIWSAGPRRLLDFPAAFFLRFFDNHGLLGVDDHHPWRVVAGGSRRYVEALTRPFRDRIRLRAPVRAVSRSAECVTVQADGAPAERFDQVIVATHADQALRLLEPPNALEQEVLRAFRYQRNHAVLHTGSSLLPRNRLARASWNYWIPPDSADAPVVTYDMSRLQGLATPEPICLTLNRPDAVDPARVLARIDFAHPLYTHDSLRAQARHHEVSGVDRIHFCGAYWGYGFHEDGVNSAVAVCRRLGAESLAA